LVVCSVAEDAASLYASAGFLSIGIDGSLGRLVAVSTNIFPDRSIL